MAMAMFMLALEIQIFQVKHLEMELSHSTLCTLSHVMLGSEVEAGTKIVEIYESLYGKRQKYQRGKLEYTAMGIWNDRKERRCVFLRWWIIGKGKHCHPLYKNTAIIYHDDWPSYSNSTTHGFTHSVVNHKKGFVSEDGACTNTIEWLWATIKHRICRMHAIPITIYSIFWTNVHKSLQIHVLQHERYISDIWWHPPIR